MLVQQLERNILATVRDKYGDLSRDNFKERLVDDMETEHLIHTRQGLYDLALLTISDTPRGKLALRKDTQNSGGAPANDKLADDVYVITHYLLGDESMDLTKCLSQRSKKNGQQVKKSARVEATINDPDDKQDDEIIMVKDNTMDRDFCVQLLTEMRRDRDLLYQEVAALRRETALVRFIQSDVRELRVDMKKAMERINKMESHVESCSEFDTVHKCKQLEKSVDRLIKRSSDIENSIEQTHINGKNIATQVANNQASATWRLNNIDLALHSARSQDVQRVVPAGPPGLIQIQPGQTQSSTALKPTCPTTNDVVVNSIANVSTNADSLSKVDRRDKHDPGNDTPYTLTVSAGSLTRDVNFRRDNNSSAPTGSSTSNDRPDSKVSGQLKGYRPGQNRSSYKVFFVSGVLILDDDVDYTVEKVKEYIDSNGCQTKSIRKVKYSRRTVSLKAVVTEDSASLIESDMFWPDGIQCRPWVD